MNLETYIDSDKLVKMDGYDDCILGVGYRCGSEQFLIYDIDKIIQKLMDVEKMTHQAAVEFHEYNQANAWFGFSTPGFISLLPK